MKLFIRVAPASKSETFRRCGMTFTREGLEVEVDDATAKRLAAEQMLDVAEVLSDDDLKEVDLAATIADPAAALAPAKTKKAK
ncbi:MAG: hypothetical protein FWH56_10765 [Betaproteobacteria bacterium]|nr:hypothetical protein [Betaproteobacteria bacterium]